MKIGKTKNIKLYVGITPVIKVFLGRFELDINQIDFNDLLNRNL